MRKTIGLILALLLQAAVLPGIARAADNQLSQSELKAGWTLLFDGKSLAGWRSFKKQTAPEKGWEVADGMLHHVAKGGGGDMITVREFDDFEAEWDWKVAEGANSGLKYFVTESRNSALGHEYQLIDDKRHPDALRGPKYQTAGFYDVFAATNRVVHPAGEWNHSRILVKGNHVEHWLNGKLALAYELGSPATLEAVAQSKFKTVEGFGTKLAGHLLVQDHGDEIWFKNMKVRTPPVKK